MHTTEEYLNQLVKDKQKLIGDLNSRGIEASDNDTFTSLANKVITIPSGEDLSEYFKDTCNGNDIRQLIKKFPSNITFVNLSTMKQTFYKFIGLVEIPYIDTHSIRDFYHCCYGCSSLITIPLLDFSSADEIGDCLTLCRSLKKLGGFKNLGKGYYSGTVENYGGYTLNLAGASSLTHDSLINVINNLYDIKTLGCKPQKLFMGNTNISKLTQTEIAIATNKGWTVR